MPTGEIRARRVLIVEDEMLLAMNLEDMLVELGHNVIAVATRITQALTLAAESEIDLAVLDLNLAGSLSFPVAEVLRRRGIPFMFATGYGSQGLIENYRNECVLVKPYGLRELQDGINKVVSAPAFL
jgi:DNA-binding response OmpR family regulator